MLRRRRTTTTVARRRRAGCSTTCSSTAIFVWAVRLLFRPQIEGEENIPRTGPAILVSNHISAGDTYLVPALIRRRLTFPAKQEMFHGRGLKGRLLAWFLTAVGQVPMDRSGGRASAGSMDSVLQVLRDGKLLGIYPEGTRSPDGRLYKGKTGVARLVLQAGVPVIPLAVIGTEFVPVGDPQGSDHEARPRVRIGTPMDFSRVRRRRQRPRGAALGHRRDHGRGDAAVRTGVRRRVRGLGQGRPGRRRAAPAVGHRPAR